MLAFCSGKYIRCDRVVPKRITPNIMNKIISTKIKKNTRNHTISGVFMSVLVEISGIEPLTS